MMSMTPLICILKKKRELQARAVPHAYYNAQAVCPEVLATQMTVRGERLYIRITLLRVVRRSLHTYHECVVLPSSFWCVIRSYWLHNGSSE